VRPALPGFWPPPQLLTAQQAGPARPCRKSGPRALDWGLPPEGLDLTTQLPELSCRSARIDVHIGVCMHGTAPHHSELCGLQASTNLFAL